MKKRYTLLILFSIILIIVIGISFYFLYLNNKPKEQPQSSSNKLLQQQEKFIKDNNYLTEGSNKSKAHVVVFTDYRCSHCSNYYYNQKLNLLQKYIDTGKVKYTEIPFPVIDKESSNYEKMARVIQKRNDSKTLIEFTKKSYQSSSIDNNPIKTLKRVNLNSKTFHDITNEYKSSNIKSNKSKIQDKFDITSTPTVFVNGKFVRDIDFMKKMVEEEIK
ncbi:TPA: DsbA family protein [Staphylococcus aureus]|nr:thioredoxin domain-containing protein [Staphylococcus aureus]HDF6783413.1 thioredoxin domain-containing protein [Staphylococcus aureus]HDG4171839.1 thioredoxin domain-containing protein [Staphylococcus aureus]HDH9847177.1 thioredoxin domain-containing protein [Staphylococcus aureus]